MLATYWSILRRRLLLIVVVSAVVGVGAYQVLTAGEDVYRSEAVVRVGTQRAADAVLGRDARFEEPDRRVANEIEIMQSPEVLERAATALGTSAEDIEDRLHFEQRGFSDAISIAGEGGSPADVQALVGAVVSAYIEHRDAFQRASFAPIEDELVEQISEVETEIAALNAERSGLAANAPAAIGLDAARNSAIVRQQELADTLSTVRLALAGDLSGVEVVSAASQPEVLARAAGPQPYVLATLAGLLVAGAVTLAVELARNPVRTSAEAERLAAVPLLATLPAAGRRASVASAVTRLRPEVLRAAHGLRLNLEGVTQPGQLPRTLMVTGTVADAREVHAVGVALAAACGQSGLSTILVADLERPDALLGSGPGSSGASPSASNGTRGNVTVLDGVRWLPATTSPGHGDGPLLAGSLGAAVGSLREVCDVAIIVPAPSVDAAEVVAAGRAVDAALAVCALGRTAAGDFQHLLSVLDRRGVETAGLVLTHPVDRNRKAAPASGGGATGAKARRRTPAAPARR